METLHAEKQDTFSQSRGKSDKTECVTRSHLTTNFKKCPNCKGSHAIYNWEQFLNLQPLERISIVKRLKLCSNCLKDNYFLKDCRSYPCRICSKYHNSLLHIVKNNADNSSLGNSSYSRTAHIDQVQNDVIDKTTVGTTILSNHALSYALSQILLATTIIEIKDAAGNLHSCRALLDIGPQSNFVTYNLCDKLKLYQLKTLIAVAGVNHVQSYINYRTNLNFYSMHNSFNKTISCLILPTITGTLPVVSFNANELEIPSNIQLADPSFNIEGEIDLLLGASLFYELLCIGQINLGKDKPILQKTLLGWIISGPVSILQKNKVCCKLSVNSLHSRNVESDLQTQLEKFWTIEEPLSNSLAKYSKEQLDAENQFVKTTTRNADGRFVVINSI